METARFLINKMMPFWLVVCGIAAAIPFAWGVVGSLCGGYLADVLVGRGVGQVNSRKYPAGRALIGTAAFTIAAAYVSSNNLAIAFIPAAIFLLYITSTCSWALSSVAVPPNLTASVGAMQNFGGYLGGALAPTVTGLTVAATGSFVLALVIGGVGVSGLTSREDQLVADQAAVVTG